MGEMVQIATVDARQMNGATRTHIDLFSGIGGFALACRWAGIETIAFCEIEKYAQRVLRKNFPGIRIFEDVRQFPATEFREPFLLTGGYPCQPFSQAGKRRGAEDDRHLWPSMFGIIRTSRPNWILAENVAGHVTLGLDEVLADLEGEDYAVQPIIVPACAVDAPHRRDRVWIMAQNCDEGVWSCCRRHDRHFQEKSGARRIVGKRSGKNDRSVITSKKNESVALSDSDGKRFKKIEPELRQSYESSCKGEIDRRLWIAEPDVGRVAHGIPRRVDRLRGLGNAIVPQVAYEIIKAMIEADESA